MSVSKSLRHLSASLLYVQQVEEKEPMKQGIVTILGSDSERNYKGSSLRRTLSADMSSKKWLSQNGFFLPVRKVYSSEQVVVVPDHHDSSSSESEEEFEKNPRQDDVWKFIQSQKNVHKQEEANVWGTILTQKSESSAARNLLPPPYIHPLVKRSACAMSERSLKICTESLGSETGSDEFCSSETVSNGDDDKEEREMAVQEAARIKAVDPFEDLHIVKYKNSPAWPIPPPLSSISGGDHGAPSLRMHAYRKNGRLVLEAVSVPPRKSFHAERKDGRLVLTMIDPLHSQENEAENRGQEFEKVFDDMEEDDGSMEERELDGSGYEENEEVDEEEEAAEVSDENFEFSTDQNGSVQKSALLMKKFMGLGNKNPNCCHEFHKSTKLIEEELTTPQSLPPRPPSVARLIPSPSTPPPVPTASTFNEYFWQIKTSTAQATVLKNYMIIGANQEMAFKKGNKTGLSEGLQQGAKKISSNMGAIRHCNLLISKKLLCADIHKILINPLKYLSTSCIIMYEELCIRINMD